MVQKSIDEDQVEDIDASMISSGVVDVKRGPNHDTLNGFVTD